MIRRSIILFIFLVLCSCGQKNVPYMRTAEDLYTEGLKQLEDGETYKAVELLQRIIYEYPGSEYIEKARLKIAEAHYVGEDYLLAANEYERFAREFPMNPRADDALYRAAIAHEMMSERSNLDQSETKKAIASYNRVVEKYPGSAYADSSVVKSYFLTDRLARKTYENGYFYYKRKYYDSAIIYFETMTREFETTSWLAPTYYYLAESYEKLKLTEEARAARLKLIEEYPGTLEAREILKRFPNLVPVDPSLSDRQDGGGTG